MATRTRSPRSTTAGTCSRTFRRPSWSSSRAVATRPTCATPSASTCCCVTSSTGRRPVRPLRSGRRRRDMRALEPRSTGMATNPCDGVRVHYEVFGPVDARRTVVFAPAGLFAYGRLWKMQVPHFARRGHRVVTYDARGSGGSDRPDTGYSPQRFEEDLLAVLDEVGVQHAAFVGMTWAIRWLGPLAARRPELVSHLVTVGSFPTFQDVRAFTAEEIASNLERFMTPVEAGTPVDWRGVDIRDRWPEVAAWQAQEDLLEPHSTRAIEDLTAWARETEGHHMLAS